METEKNISITLKQPDEDDNSVAISFSTLAKQAKRYFILWLIAAAVVLMFTVGFVMMFKKSTTDNMITALVSFNFDGIEKGLDPQGKKFDVNKIKSPNVIEAALTDMDISLNFVEGVRRNIYINGVIPNDAMDKISLYKNIYSEGGSAALTAVESMLELGYYPSYYIISFDYYKTGFDLSESKQILDKILKSYQNYFFTNYGYNESLGNAVVAVDYKEYDYPAAIDVFNTTLTNLSDYVSKLSNADAGFRSNETGYSFSDLKTTIDTLKNADLDSLSSYIVINNVTNDKELLLTYYKYRIEELSRQQKISQSELDSITNSIDNYEKDTLLFFGDGTENAETSYSQASQKYDELINQKIAKQNEVSRNKQRVEYYNDRIDALKSNNSSLTVSKEDVEERLEEINNKITDLIDTVNKTADEYYETVTFANAYNILVPAMGTEPTVVTGDFFMPVFIAEGILLVIYLAIVFIKTIKVDYKASKTDSEVKQIKEK